MRDLFFIAYGCLVKGTQHETSEATETVVIWCWKWISMCKPSDWWRGQIYKSWFCFFWCSCNGCFLLSYATYLLNLYYYSSYNMKYPLHFIFVSHAYCIFQKIFFVHCLLKRKKKKILYNKNVFRIIYYSFKKSFACIGHQYIFLFLFPSIFDQSDRYMKMDQTRELRFYYNCLTVHPKVEKMDYYKASGRVTR